jgi:DNA-binding NarL/FixJ family response regulator
MAAKKIHRDNRDPVVDASPPMNRIRVVVVDDHPLCRKGLHQILQDDGRFEFAGEANDNESGLKMIFQEKPDVAVLDVSPSGVNGLEMAGVLKAKKSATRILILTAISDERLLNKALSLGITGYVLKMNGASEVLNCVAAVAAGKAYVSPSLTDFLLRRRTGVEFLERRRPGLEGLTAAERRILKDVAQGKTSKAIAAELSISQRTVESHRTSISSKLQLKGPNSLLQFAVEHRDALNHLT